MSPDNESLEIGSIKWPDLGKLQELTDSQAWSELTPNYPSPTALLPRDLTPMEILAAIKIVVRCKSGQSKGEPVGDWGRLEKIGGGEAKTVYLLTKDSKQIAIALGGYDEAPQIPEDPRLLLFTHGLGKNFYRYSDLRTYLCFPLRLEQHPYGILLQEYGGKEHISSFYDPRRILAEMEVRRYIASRGLKVGDPGEFAHTRHYLINQPGLSLPAVIDIPVSSR